LDALETLLWTDSVAPPGLKLASACSVKGWIHQAELLFAVLRSPYSLEIVTFEQQFEIAIEYCLHLRRRKRHTELVFELQSTFTKLESSPRSILGGFMEPVGVRHHTSVLKDILERVLRESNMLPNLEIQASELRNKIDTFVAANFTLARETNIRGNSGEPPATVLVRHPRLEDEDDDDDAMTDFDCLSSNKLGVTYTESGTSGISFNYSELYR
jgi:hypothetical protein